MRPIRTTVRPRIQQLIASGRHPTGPIVVDIAESPVELAERLIHDRSVEDPIRQRAEQSRETLLSVMSEQDWRAYAARASHTRTVLAAIGRPAAVRLIRLGYLGTAIACHAYLDAAGVERSPNDSWFKGLFDGRLDAQQLQAPQVW